MKTYRESNPPPWRRDPSELLNELFERFDAAQDQLAEIAATSSHDATRVGAIRTGLDALDRQVQLLMSLGVLPRDLGSFEVQADVEWTAKRLIAILEKHEVPDAVLEEIAEVFSDSGVSPKEPAPLSLPPAEL